MRVLWVGLKVRCRVRLGIRFRDWIRVRFLVGMLLLLNGRIIGRMRLLNFDVF